MFLYNQQGVSSVEFAKSKPLQAIEKQMDKATDYQEWSDLAKRHDELSGMARWKSREQSNEYDHSEISLRLQRLRQLLGRQDFEGLLFALNEGIHGNMGGMGNAILYNRAKFGTKDLINDYIDALAESIERVISDNCQIPIEEKLDFLHRASHCFGRSALMLSGAGNFGHFHVGVAKALLDNNLLPHVISGSSAGALTAGCLGTNSDAKLRKLLDIDSYFSDLDDLDGQKSLSSKLLFGKQSWIDLDYLEDVLNLFVADLSFAEAFDLTGRAINISVSPQEEHQTPRLLNSITAPNVLVRSAVRASCAVPGAFPAVNLEAKAENGDRIPYLPSRKWIDGSVVGDLPAKRLARLYGVNHFIVSQANPLVLWAKTDPKTDHGLRANVARFITRATKEGFNSGYRVSRTHLKKYPTLRYAANMMFSVLNQEYSGDINLYPKFRFFDPRMLLKRLSKQEALELAKSGERATWPKIEMIRNCMRLSTILDEGLAHFGNDHNAAAVPKIVYKQKNIKSNPDTNAA